MAPVVLVSAVSSALQSCPSRGWWAVAENTADCRGPLGCREHPVVRGGAFVHPGPRPLDTDREPQSCFSVLC